MVNLPLGEFMNSPDENHSSGFGAFTGFVAGLLDPRILLLNFAVVMCGLGIWSVVDSIVDFPVGGKLKEKLMSNKFGRQILDEIHYYAGWSIVGTILGLLLRAFVPF